MTGELQPTGVDVIAPQGPASPDIERVSRSGLRVAFLTFPTGVELYVGESQHEMKLVWSVDGATSDPESISGVLLGFLEHGHFELVPEAHLESLVAFSDAIDVAYSGAIGEVDQGWVLDPAQTDGEKLFPESPHNFVLVPLANREEGKSAFDRFVKEVEEETDADPTGESRRELESFRDYYFEEAQKRKEKMTAEERIWGFPAGTGEEAFALMKQMSAEDDAEFDEDPDS